MASLTVGYSDSEDRVWVRLVVDKAEQRVWLTRRSVLALIKALASALEASLVELDALLQMDSAQRLAMELDEATAGMGSSAPEPAPNSKDYRVTDSGLCALFDLDTQSSKWVVRLHTVCGKPLVFDGSRLQMHQLLKSLLNRQHEANWGLYTPGWSTGSL